MFQSSLKPLLILLAVFLLTVGIGCRGGSQQAKKAASESVKLTIWSVFDTQKDLSGIMNAYSQRFPNVKFEVKTFNFQEYEKELLGALAEDRGPDLFAIPNTWTRAYEGKISFMPSEVTLPVQIVQGTIKKETVIELQKIRMLSPKTLKTKFIDAVYNDVVYEVAEEVDGKKQKLEKISALPLSVDVLALYSNVDLLNSAGISVPATDWRTFADHAQKLTRLDPQGNILQAGAAIGTGKNIERASDIVSLLMMQNGTEMTSGDGQVITFHQYPKNYNRERVIPPGEEALSFYTDFANKNSSVYTYNHNLPNSLQAFLSGQVAYFFGYSYHRPLIEKQAPRLKFQISPSPIISGNPDVHYANYWVYTVSKKSKHPDWAWHFLIFATDAENVSPYLASLRKPTGLRTLVDQQKQDPEMKAFADMVLTAKTWYHGHDAPTAEKILREMIDSVVEGRAFPRDAVDQAAGMVQQTMR